VLCAGDLELVLRGSASLATEHRMTLTAVTEGLLALPRTIGGVTVHVQPGHVLVALGKGWPALWRERDWVKQDGTPVKNRDLWERLVVATERRNIRWRPFASSGGAQQQERVSAIAAAQR
jgi:ribonuclease HI